MNKENSEEKKLKEEKKISEEKKSKDEKKQTEEVTPKKNEEKIEGTLNLVINHTL